MTNPPTGQQPWPSGDPRGPGPGQPAGQPNPAQGLGQHAAGQAGPQPTQPAQTGSWGAPANSGSWGAPAPTGQPAKTSKRKLLPAIIAGAIVVVLAVVVVLVTTLGGSADASDYGLSEADQQAAPDVSEVAAEAAQAADDLDVEAGLALMCTAPSAEQIEGLNLVIAEANEKAGGEAQKKITLTDAVQDGDEGTVTVVVEGLGSLRDYTFEAQASLKRVDGEWCISEIYPID